MAKKALVEKANKKPKFGVRGYTRCNRCGRPRAVYRTFGLCRICFREMAHAGQLPGITKSSWESAPPPWPFRPAPLFVAGPRSSLTGTGGGTTAGTGRRPS